MDDLTDSSLLRDRLAAVVKEAGELHNRCVELDDSVKYWNERAAKLAIELSELENEMADLRREIAGMKTHGVIDPDKLRFQQLAEYEHQRFLNLEGEYQRVRAQLQANLSLNAWQRFWRRIF